MAHAVVELRAAIIIGAGSASFEMLRSLVDVLPVMIAPRWVTQTRVQPIAIGDVLEALTRSVSTACPGRMANAADRSDQDGEHHVIVEIGCPDVMTYRQLMDLYAEVAGLRRRVLIPVPFVTPASPRTG